MSYKYAQTGPPFSFLGHMSETQFAALQNWTGERAANFPGIELHHRVRAQQLRKTAGMLEAFYGGQPDALAPSFQKDAWQPSAVGHWPYAFRDDHIPAQTMVELKQRFRYQLEQAEEALFHMNHVRAQIESQEDKAQYMAEAPAAVAAYQAKVKTMFGQPEYQAVLVRDRSDTYKGQPRFRVNQLDPPTAWEQEQHNHPAFNRS